MISAYYVCKTWGFPGGGVRYDAVVFGHKMEATRLLQTLVSNEKLHGVTNQNFSI